MQLLVLGIARVEHNSVNEIEKHFCSPAMCAGTFALCTSWLIKLTTGLALKVVVMKLAAVSYHMAFNSGSRLFDQGSTL
jgi:hypothetical protein